MFDIPQKGKKVLNKIKDKISKIFSKLDQYEIKWSGISIIDMESDVGAEAEAKTIRHPNGQVCADVHIAYPTFEVMLFDDDDVNSIIGTIPTKAVNIYFTTIGKLAIFPPLSLFLNIKGILL